LIIYPYDGEFIYAFGDVINELGVLGEVGVVVTLQSKFKFRCNERLSNCTWKIDEIYDLYFQENYALRKSLNYIPENYQTFSVELSECSCCCQENDILLALTFLDC
jgi:hypothetical protein